MNFLKRFTRSGVERHRTGVYYCPKCTAQNHADLPGLDEAEYGNIQICTGCHEIHLITVDYVGRMNIKMILGRYKYEALIKLINIEEASHA